MPIARWKMLPAGAAIMLAGLAGCSSDSDKDRSGKPVVTSPSDLPDSCPTLRPKKADLPEPPESAGPIDGDAPEEFTATRTGLYYRILRKGTGRKPKSYDTIIAHYKGWLDNGKQFDSSYDRVPAEPATFPLSGVVPGWTEGLQLVGEGGMIELEIPGKLGYGPQGRPPNIPPNATLHFIIELKKIK